MSQTEHQKMTIITGMSGAGRSTVANTLEDLGWYVVDNLPPKMLEPLVDLCAKASSALPKVAVVVDVRGRDLFNFDEFDIDKLRKTTDLKIIFLEATDSALIRRFESVRRPHPLQGNGTISDGILAERDRMSNLRAQSDIIIDTSNTNIHQLSTKIYEIYSNENDSSLKLTVMSFGFKYGLPRDVDLVCDGRFLPNPFWVPELKSHTGKEKEVSDYVLASKGAKEFLDKYLDSLFPVFEGYKRENKRHVTLAIGCTGGKHRSVALAEELSSRLINNSDISVHVKHRDLGRE